MSVSTNAIFLGGTFEPTPSTAYVDAAESLYLEPLGFSGAASICDMVGTAPCEAPLQVLTTPELLEFGPASLQDETDIVNAVEAEYERPSQRRQRRPIRTSGSLAGYTPDDLYQTTVYTIDTDGVADWREDWNAALAADNGNAFDALGNAFYHFFTTHVEYLGLTPEEIATGVATTEGMTTTIIIPDGSDMARSSMTRRRWWTRFHMGS